MHVLKPVRLNQSDLDNIVHWRKAYFVSKKEFFEGDKIIFMPETPADVQQSCCREITVVDRVADHFVYSLGNLPTDGEGQLMRINGDRGQYLDLVVQNEKLNVVGNMPMAQGAQEFFELVGEIWQAQTYSLDIYTSVEITWFAFLHALEYLQEEPEDAPKVFQFIAHNWGRIGPELQKEMVKQIREYEADKGRQPALQEILQRIGN